MICYSTIRAAVTSVVAFALITTTICCRGEGDSRQKRQKDLMADVRGGQPIYIRDRQLLSLVRQAVGTGAEFVTDKQMAMLQEIIAAPHFTLESRVEPNPIRDLEGLEFATGLTHLDLSGHHLIDDITPNDWGHITLFNFDNYDYSPLDTLDTIAIEITYAMNHLHLVQTTANICDIDDLTPLASLKNLKHLSLTVQPRNNLPDASEGIKPLAGLSSLETLRLSGSSDIYDLTPLAGLKNLKHLYLDNCGIRDWGENAIAPLAGLTNLETLHLNNNTIYDLTPLAGLTNLRYLDLSQCGLQDITPLAGLTNLEYLSLAENDDIDDLTPLAALTNLKALILQEIVDGYSDSIDLTPLAGLTNLEILNVSENRGAIQDITPLAGLTNLKILDLTDAALNNLTPLAELTNLEILNLNSAGYFLDLSGIISGRLGSTLTPLAGLTNLSYLNLSGTYFEDITPLAGLTNLEWLDVQGQDDYRLKDITPLAGLTNLAYLNVRSDPIEDITPLAGLTNLRHLYLGGGNPNRSLIDDLTPLARLTNLEKLFLYIKDTVDVLPLCKLKTTAIYGVELDCK